MSVSILRILMVDRNDFTASSNYVACYSFYNDLVLTRRIPFQNAPFSSAASTKLSVRARIQIQIVINYTTLARYRKCKHEIFQGLRGIK